MFQETRDKAREGLKLFRHGSNSYLAALTHLRRASALCHIILYRTAAPTKYLCVYAEHVHAEMTKVGRSLTQAVDICEMHLRKVGTP